MVSCVLINFNGEKFIKACLESLEKQTLKDKEVIIIDNASSDNSVNLVLKQFPEVKVVRNKDNKGYAAGANQAIEISTGEFVMISNVDIIFEPDYLKILVRRVYEKPFVGGIIGKLLQYDVAAKKKTRTIDSAGLHMMRSRRCVDRGQGETDEGQYDSAEEVFGITGACPMYRRRALEQVKIGDHYFDEDFFMYKEDVDLSWRMNLCGWRSFYEPSAVAYHARGTGVLNRSTLREVRSGRQSLSEFQRYYSYKNERLMRAKNETWEDFWPDSLHIIWREMLMTGWIIVKERFLIKSFFHFLWQLPRALYKRREIMKKRRQM